ncbi:MAG: hypothetical protein LUF92_03840 [Clostridiales bacterium]|nr:hypothetical protein [Clostridiales bacterium]
MKEVKKNDTILELHKARFNREAQGVFDDKLHILVYDIIYCAHAYDFYEHATISTTSTKERIRRATLREQYEEARSRYHAVVEARDNIAVQAGQTVDLTEKKLKHKTYGIGTVKSHANRTLAIEFGAGTVGTKKFQYPNAIKAGFLSAVDDEVAADIQREISKVDLENAEKELSAAKDEYENIKMAMGIKG